MNTYTKAHYYEDAMASGLCSIEELEQAAQDIGYDDAAPLVETIYTFSDGSKLKQVHGEYWAE